MPARVLETILTGRDQLSPVLAKAAASTEAFEHKVEDANAGAARASTNAAQVHQAAAKATTQAATQIHGARGQFEAAGADLGDAIGVGLVRDASGRLRNARGQFASDAEKALAGIDPVAEKHGDEAGGRLARGLSMGLTRNSPLIVAAVSGAMALGAPALIAGAAVLFAGIGGAAASQSLEVRKAWLDSFHSIRDGVVADAAVLVPAVADMGRQLGVVFEHLQPAIRAAFTAAAPLIESFTHSLANAAEIIVPALTRAVQAAGPVIDGLGHFIEQIAVGLAQMFDTMSAHSGAAGTALAAVGDILSALLPILGELLGAGAEIAADVLPPLASALHVVADALHAIAPILPAVVGGFLAFKVVSALSGPIESLGKGIGKLVGEFKVLSGEPVKAASGLESFVGALGPVGIGVGLAVAQFALWETQLKSWGEALATGGQQASEAAQQIREVEKFATIAGSGIQGFIGRLTGYGFALDAAGHASEDAAKAQKEYEDSLNPVEAAQLRVTKAQDALTRAMESGDPARVAAAQRDYRDASEAAAAAQGELEMAIHGVTQAMIDQADTALASIDSQFAMQQAAINTQRAIDDLHTTQADSKATALDLAQSQLDVATSLKAQAVAVAQAKADYSGLTEGTAEYNRLIQTETLKSLQDLRAQFPEFGPVIDGMIAQLVAAGVSVNDLGNATATPTVDLNKSPFDQALDATYGLLGILGIQRPTPVADLNKGPLAINWGTAMNNIAILSGQRPTPVAGMNSGPFTSIFNSVMGLVATVGAQRPTPTVGLNDQASGGLIGIRNLLGGIVSKTVTVTVKQSVVGALTGIAAAARGASGGIFRPMAAGGVLPLGAGGLAGVYAPNTPVLIGDNRRVPESYVPQDGSSRSWEILRRTVTGMVAATGYRPPDFSPAAMPGYGASVASRTAGPVNVSLSLAGATVTGRFEFGSDGLVRLVDGRIDGKLGDLADYAHYNS